MEKIWLIKVSAWMMYGPNRKVNERSWVRQLLCMDCRIDLRELCKADGGKMKILNGPYNGECQNCGDC